MKKTQWIRPIAAVLFFMLLLSLAVEIHVFANKDLPLIIMSKAEMLYHMMKTILALCFLYGVWKGYV